MIIILGRIRFTASGCTELDHYEPNEDGTECVKQQDHQCAPFNEPGDWSECLWFPLADMFKKVQSHCGVEGKPEGLSPSSLAPAGFQIPEKCGFCSFRLKCQSREKKEGCFPLKVDKKSCGAEDCPTCGDVCTLDKQNNSCAFTKAMGMKFWNSFAHKAKESNLAHWRRDGYADLFKFLPYGHCKEVGDKCKCCCHPYEPNEDGTACVVKQYCKSLEEVGGKKQQKDQPESEKKAENMPETTGNASHHQHRHHHGDSSSESHEQHHHHHH
ncbi:Poly-cysteine and histidine-tailed protein [Trichinella spiralis]|uniref:Poly-cysteine and histidine-tailed protein n=1 Tax=Trichinella spiralis TaxID=6334 RepID=A0A0V1BCE9_TRISP|nr:Poly-cysteine and histidine-tailed protein [Trichinella spiralis]